MDSILLSIRQLLGIPTQDNNFDAELILHINNSISILTQIGIGPPTGFKITGTSETWESLTQGRLDLEMIKTAVYLRVRLTFDSPQNSFLVTSIQEQLKELDWRIEIAVTQQEM